MESDAKRDAKAQALAEATQTLTLRVTTLTDVVQTNNKEMKRLRSEINRKPDDVEVQFITNMSRVTLRKVRNRAIATGVLAALFSGMVSYAVADYAGQRRCEVNAQNISAIVRLLESLPDPKKRLTPTITDLRSNRNDC